MAADHLSIGEARRIALGAQGFGRPRPAGPVRARQVREVIRRLGLLQLDPINVLVQAPYLVLFSRLGPYDRQLLDELVYRRREFTEQWAHEACIIPVETWPLLRHRMENHRVRPYGFETFLEQNGAYFDWVLEEVRSRGPLAAEDLAHPEGVARRIPADWPGSVPRATLEAHFGRGVLAVAKRKPNLARCYDLAERLIAAEHHGRPVRQEDAQRELLLMAARAHGVGTAADLADYYRMPPRQAGPRLAELVESGALRTVSVEGWREPAFLHPASTTPRRIDASALLSPFDPVVWFRLRASRLFGFEYRIEIYVPPAQRQWGYYVLPFLFEERIAARVDLKADRAARRLLVQAAYLEPHATPGPVAEALSKELAEVAEWLNLETVSVGRRGGFARTLAAAVGARPQAK